jgi:hypothetical protein
MTYMPQGTPKNLIRSREYQYRTYAESGIPEDHPRPDQDQRPGLPDCDQAGFFEMLITDKEHSGSRSFFPDLSGDKIL